ncbi:MAG: RNA methyltransferase [Terracidiphilus sp.]
MLTEAQRDHIEVVLVSPRNPLNIGAAARAMTNFGFSRLSVVAPYEPHWHEAKSAVGAEELLKNARRTESLQEAVTECTLVIGTGTLAHRRPEQPALALPRLRPRIDQELERGGGVALVFGPEKHGLTRKNLALCHLLVEIPTDPRQPSINLGQAVAVCLYELAAERGASPGAGGNEKSAARLMHADPDESALAPASMRDLDLLAEVIAETMQAADYSPAAMQRANRHDLDLLLRRLVLTRGDARRILGLFRRILWRLRR